MFKWLDTDPANMEIFMRSRKDFDKTLLCDREGDTSGSRPLGSIPTCVKVLIQAAAMIALAVSFGYWTKARTEERMAALTNTVVVPAGQRVNVILPDGTNVWLNSLSQLSYPAAFTGGGRHVELSGEGFFEVTRDEKNPFTVHTDRYDVKVLGTQFNIASLPGADNFTISVVEGKVQVMGQGDNSESLILTMNQQAFEAEGHLRKQAFFDGDVFLWRQGLLCFRSTRLEDLFDRFEHTYGIKVVSQPASLPSALFSGKFRTSDGIFHALNILQREAPFSYRWDEERNIIYIN
jgi:ferric-dicitrate binding protein FerR (iron transport regulator)